MMSEEKKAYPFALVGFFVTEKNVSDVFRTDVSPEQLEEIRELIKKLIFVEGVDVAIAPFVVPPDQVNDALQQLAEAVFSPPEEGKDN
ncbi:hypothetical protein GWK41_02415 [Persephonella atlantica]|uniref:Uncharacterized protein n=2 Tax=Persephonella atlantica TaxID=2699429 RepID=A0ABS1GG69_9AQUI|nr:hypothetical protein [Persephonella atlantica]